MKRNGKKRYRQTPPGKCGTAFEARCVFQPEMKGGFSWICMLYDRMEKFCGSAHVDTSKKPASVKFKD